MGVGLGAYAQVLADREARSFSLAGLVARMPLSMSGLGIVLLVSLETGSFGRAGTVTAFGTVAGAVAAPLWGRLIDRVGQARVLLTAAVVNAVSVLALVLTVEAGLPLATTCLAAVGIGAGFSSAGAAVRARWAHRLGGGPRLDTAYAVEAMLDEVVFIVGPVLVTFLATSVHPALGLGACVLFGLTGAVALAVQRGTQPPYGATVGDRDRSVPIGVGLLLPVALASVAIGAIFGGMEVVVVAFATAAGVLEYSGLLLLAWAVGSLAAGLVVGTIRWRVPPSRRFRVSAALLALSTVPLPFVSDPVALGLLLLLGGVAIAPTMISSVAVVQSSVPAGRLTEAFGWTSTGLATGIAVGAASLGYLVDLHGPVGGFWGAVAFGGLLLGLTLLVRERVVPRPADVPVDVSPERPGTPAAGPAPDAARSLSS